MIVIKNDLFISVLVFGLFPSFSRKITNMQIEFQPITVETLLIMLMIDLFLRPTFPYLNSAPDFICSRAVPV